MIIGNGDIASVLLDKEDLVFFASGVSNSQEIRESEYQREVDLLMQQDKTKHIVYFSSLCVFYSDSRYARHKQRMETLIKEHFEKWTIMRLGNITWGNNPSTLINHLRKQKKDGEPLEIQNVQRYIVNKDEFLHWVNQIPKWSCEMNITGQRMWVSQIVNQYVNQ